MKQAPYGSWKSPITSDLIVAQSIGLSDVRLDGNEIYWLESRPQEAGRGVVVVHRPEGKHDLTPQPYNVRTRVHEYGGGAWRVSRETLYFSHDVDRRLYRLEAGGTPQALTPPGPWRYADGILDQDRQRWIGIREDHSVAGHEPVNTIVSTKTSGNTLESSRILLAGHDFYSSPKLSPDGRWLAFLAWDHPRMPWMGTELYLVPLDSEGLPSDKPLRVAGSATESIFQPEWSPDGTTLVFVSDRSGWWNLYQYELSSGRTEALAPMDAEFGQPQWVFGMSCYAFADPGRLVCSYQSQGLGHLALLDLSSRTLAQLDLPYTDFTSVRASGNLVVFRGGSTVTPASIVRLELDSGRTEVLQQSTDVASDPQLSRYFTPAQSVEFPTEQGLTAFGLYYPPANPDYQAPEGERPPLVVKVHGGPTAAASGILDLRTQFWTSRGIAVLDVNYGGSTGFGRAYRQRLDSNWGVVDVDDCVNGARYLASQGLADAHRAVITGGSAGGYTALAALSFRDYFRGGASHYGVSDLAVLASDTHKFEARYLDTLIGPYPEMEALYRERSPIFHTAQLSVPVIFFQGEEDLVVPPSQSERMVAALREKGVPVGYLLFAGEQHGFRKAENIKRSLDAELYFYAVNVFRTALAF